MDLRIKEQKEMEAKQLELIRQKEMQIVEENERHAREAAAVEEECQAIERECAILKVSYFKHGFRFFLFLLYRMD